MKAILVIDMPKCCEECRLINRHYDNEDGEWQFYCGADYHRIREKNKKYYCPLKPMPKKKKLDEDLFLSNNFGLVYARFDGYNKCIDEILGEEE